MIIHENRTAAEAVLRRLQKEHPGLTHEERIVSIGWPGGSAEYKSISAYWYDRATDTDHLADILYKS